VYIKENDKVSINALVASSARGFLPDSMAQQAQTAAQLNLSASHSSAAASHSQKLTSICQRIESDPNYQPNITDKELLNLQHLDVTTLPTARPMAIQKYEHNSIWGIHGTIYQIKQVVHRFEDNIDPFGFYAIDDSEFIIIDPNGECSIYRGPDYKNGVYGPRHLSNKTIHDFLNKECFHNVPRESAAVLQRSSCASLSLRR